MDGATNQIWPWWPTLAAGSAAIISLMGVAITIKSNRAIEKLRSRGAERLENISYRNRLRIAALKKRLEVHQQAYTVCYQLNAACKYSKDFELITPYINECSLLVMQNRLYLESDVAEGIVTMQANAVLFIHGDHVSPDHIQARWNRVREAILRAMELPSIADEEKWHEIGQR